MKVRYFLSIVILYIAVVVGYIFYLVPGEYTLTNQHLITFSFTLPIALWFCVSLVGLLLITGLYLLCTWFVAIYKKVLFGRDINKLIVQIREMALGEIPKQRVFVIPDIKQISDILKRFYFIPNLNSKDTQDVKLDTMFVGFQQIADGTESKNLKLHTANPLYFQNLKNSMSHDAQRSLEILAMDIHDKPNGHEFYDNLCAQDIYNLAWDNILESKSSKILKKALQLSTMRLSAAIVKKICLLRIQEENNLNSEEIIRLCKMTNLNEREYLDIVISLCHYVNSGNISFWLDVFDKLSKEIERSVFAYFYLLLEVGKTNEALDLKKQYPKNDYLPVSAFIALRDKGYPLLVFFDPLLYRANKPTTPLPKQQNLHIDYEIPHHSE
ncbi:hypothetical protein CQA66_01100 [Helicobacter aurati]|uniref:DUF1049 domain-containing protein n=1 Tax=Helicobacter aurati TaxID=137778 RepID=A0A3D8JA80_9HELI|nr:hypothetical protein [Helicobacter aurati]RDU73811.1 hypothetical protein CQA66_01100 [Helicobacter aurati]